MTWQEALAGYSVEGIDPIFKFWCGKLTGSKDERRARIARVFADEAELARSVAGWPTDVLRGLAMAFQLEGADCEQLAAHLAGAGVERAADVVMTLMERGVLLPVSAVSSPSWAVREGVPLQLVPGFLPVVRTLPAPPLTLAAVPASAVVVVERSDGEALVPALADILTLAARGKVQLLNTGLPSKPTMAAVRKAVVPYPGVDGVILLHAAVGGELLLSDGVGHALPAPPEERPARAEQTLQQLIFGLTQAGWWVDDHGAVDDNGAVDDTSLSHILRDAHREPPTPAELCDARALLLGLVRRMPSGTWVAVDSLVDEAVRLAPQIGYRRVNLETSYYAGVRPITATELRIQRNLLNAILVRTFFALGLVDRGSTAPGPLPRLARPPRDFNLDRRFRGRYRTTPELPVWQAAPVPLVVRRSALGDRLLGARPAAPSTPVGAVHLGADFSVTGPRDGLPGGLRTALDRLAVALPLGSGDDVRRWRIERDRWIQASQGGVDAAGTLSELARLSGKPVPPEVAAATSSWIASFGDVAAWVAHDLVEWPDAHTRERALKKLPEARPVGERFAIVPAGAIPGSVIEASAPPPRSLCTDDEGCVFPVAGIDLAGQALLDRIAPPDPDGVRCLNRTAVAASELDTLITALEQRLAAPMARGFMARLVAWSGELGPASAATVEVVQFASQHHAALALALPELAACVEGGLGNGVVVVAPGQLGALRKALADLGVKLKSGLALEVGG